MRKPVGEQGTEPAKPHISALVAIGSGSGSVSEKAVMEHKVAHPMQSLFSTPSVYYYKEDRESLTESTDCEEDLGRRQCRRPGVGITAYDGRCNILVLLAYLSGGRRLL